VAFTMLLVSPLSWNHHWVWVLLLVVLAGAPGQARATRCWLGAAVLVFVARAIWLVTYRDGAEFGTTGLALLSQNAYVIVGLAVLVWLALRARRPVRDAARR
jgi:alpha-1,2-mannosyltransferase